MDFYRHEEGRGLKLSPFKWFIVWPISTYFPYFINIQQVSLHSRLEYTIIIRGINLSYFETLIVVLQQLTHSFLRIRQKSTSPICGVSSFLSNSQFFHRLFNSEDVSVGLWLAPVANIDRKHDFRFNTEYKSRGCSNQYIITHKQSSDDMKNLWDNYLTTGLLCAKEVQHRLSYEYNWTVQPSACCSRMAGIPWRVLSTDIFLLFEDSKISLINNRVVQYQTFTFYIIYKAMASIYIFSMTLHNKSLYSRKVGIPSNLHGLYGKLRYTFFHSIFE